MSHSLRVRCLAEAAGTALLVGVGTGTLVAGYDLGGLPLWVVAVAWFAAVAVPIQAFAALSGAHLNPAVTVGLIASRRFPAPEGVSYVGSQLSGAFAGSLTVEALLGRGANLGATLPGPGGLVGVVLLEATFTCLLVGSVLILARLERAPTRFELLLPAAVVGVSTYLIGPWTGSSLNPARSIAPAVLSGQFDGLWVYVLAAVLGSLAAAAVSARIR